jgi:serine/threonine protein kinase
MSPEICAAERYSLYSDIWSLGCLLYELCAKEPPFNARTHIDLFHKIKTGRVAPIPPVYSAELQKVITSCLQVNPNARPDTCALLNLPVVKLMRKEQEVVSMGKQLKVRTKELNERIARLDSEKELLRADIDASVRREWEVKARLEIDRQIKLEKERLEKIFESEVTRRVEERVSVAQSPSEPLPARSSTPVEPEMVPLPVGDTSSEFSSLSIEDEPTRRKTSRTPFARAQTMFANQPAASPMDVTMADPSPMSIKGLSLSPRRNGGRPPAQSRLNIFEIASSASELDESTADDEDDDDDELPSLPSPTRDPFKALNKRPNMVRQKTMPANTKRLASTPNLFAAANRGQDVRPASAVPVVATSPVRRVNPSPAKPKSGIASALLSPVRKPTKDAGSKGKKDEGIHKTAMQNRLQGGLHGRTLVELNTHARNGGVDRSGKALKATVKEIEPPVWDPESDDMPSPFLSRKGRR